MVARPKSPVRRPIRASRSCIVELWWFQAPELWRQNRDRHFAPGSSRLRSLSGNDAVDQWPFLRRGLRGDTIRLLQQALRAASPCVRIVMNRAERFAFPHGIADLLVQDKADRGVDQVF